MKSLRYGRERVLGRWPTAQSFCAVGALQSGYAVGALQSGYAVGALQSGYAVGAPERLRGRPLQTACLARRA